MGRNVNAVPNDDPTRLARVLDAKIRTIGVRTLTAAPPLFSHHQRTHDQQA
jgi:hypothetical protein